MLREEREEERRPREDREEEKKAQEAREEQQEERKAHEKRKETIRARGERQDESSAQRKRDVEEKKKEENMNEHDVSNRHMTWCWRASRTAAEEARDENWVGETQRGTEEVERQKGGGRKGESKSRRSRQNNEDTLHLV